MSNSVWTAKKQTARERMKIVFIVIWRLSTLQMDYSLPFIYYRFTLFMFERVCLCKWVIECLRSSIRSLALIIQLLDVCIYSCDHWTIHTPSSLIDCHMWLDRPLCSDLFHIPHQWVFDFVAKYISIDYFKTRHFNVCLTW